MSISNSVPAAPRRAVLRRGLLAASLVAGGIVIGAGGLAVASVEGGMGWHHHHHGPMVGMIQHRLRGALDNVGATTVQEDKVHDVVANAYAELQKDGEKSATRKRVLELMKAPTLDRAAFETLRAEKVAAMDAKSKVVTNALFDAASQLSPEQRAKLVGNFEERMKQGGGWHHDRMDGPDDGRGDRGQGGRDGGADRG